MGWPDWPAGCTGWGRCSGPAVAWVSMGVGCSCRDIASVRDLWFSVDQLAQDSAEVILYFVGSGSQWAWRGCTCSCCWPVDWVEPLWLGSCLWGSITDPVRCWQSSLCCTQGLSVRLIGLVWHDQQFSHVSGGTCAFSSLPSWLYSTSICWNIPWGWLMGPHCVLSLRGGVDCPAPSGTWNVLDFVITSSVSSVLSCTIFIYHQLHFIWSRFAKLSVHHTAMALCADVPLKNYSLTQCIVWSNISSSSTLLTHCHPISITNPQKYMGSLLTDYNTTLSGLINKHVPLNTEL